MFPPVGCGTRAVGVVVGKGIELSFELAALGSCVGLVHQNLLVSELKPVAHDQAVVP